MKREEAKRRLLDIERCTPIHTREYARDFEALETAIQALSQEPCTDAVSRQAAIDTIESWLSCDDYNEAERHIMRAMQSVLYDLPPVTQKPIECDDVVSRKELLKAIDTWDKFGCDADTKLVRYQDHYIPYIHYDDVIKCIKGMPSVTQKSGNWIAYEVQLPDRTILNYRCSVCGRKLIGYSTETLSEAPFCHCGARMESESDA